MKIILTLLVRDEADILAANLDYHFSQGVDFVIATDNGSLDDTVAILQAFERRGRLRLLHEAPADWPQQRWVTRMARMASSDYRAQWVINSDADEFFAWREGTLRQALRRVPASVGAFHVPREDFVPFERPCAAPPPVEMVYRKAFSTNPVGERLNPKAIHRGAPDVRVNRGNHKAFSARWSEIAPPQGIEIFHYPIRSYEQFERKTRNMGSGYAINAEVADRPNVGRAARLRYQLLLTGDLERHYWDEQFYSAEKLAAGLASGDLLRDPLIAERLTCLLSTPPPGPLARLRNALRSLGHSP